MASSQPQLCTFFQNRTWRLLLLALLLWAATATVEVAAAGDDDETYYVNQLLRDLDSNGGQDQQQSDKLVSSKDVVKRHWGISDATTAAGKIFSYPIPDDAFTGKIQKFEVSNFFLLIIVRKYIVLARVQRIENAWYFHLHFQNTFISCILRGRKLKHFENTFHSCFLFKRVKSIFPTFFTGTI